MSPKTSFSEFEFIRALGGKTPPSLPIVLGIGDDCAILNTPKRNLLISTDLLTEGVHFELAWCSPRLLGRKSVYVNLSDIAAMGGIPVALLTAIAIPKKHLKYLKAFMAGVKEACREFEVTLIGGDTSGSRAKMTITHTILGLAGKSKPVLRTGAKTDDLIFCTGQIGLSGMGLRILQNKRLRRKLTSHERDICLRRFLTPKPRLESARRLLSKIKVHSMIDVSDGLIQDLMHILIASGRSAQLDMAALPVPPFLKKSGLSSTKAASSGEDYELLFTAAAKDRKKVLSCGTREVPIHEIGRILSPPRKAGLIVDSDFKMVADPLHLSGGYQHF